MPLPPPATPGFTYRGASSTSQPSYIQLSKSISIPHTLSAWPSVSLVDFCGPVPVIHSVTKHHSDIFLLPVGPSRQCS